MVRCSFRAVSRCSSERYEQAIVRGGIGVWSGLATGGSAVGLCVGGWLVDHATWRAVFLLDVPLIVAGLAVLLTYTGLRRTGQASDAEAFGRRCCCCTD